MHSWPVPTINEHEAGFASHTQTLVDGSTIPVHLIFAPRTERLPRAEKVSSALLLPFGLQFSFFYKETTPTAALHIQPCASSSPACLWSIALHPAEGLARFGFPMEYAPYTIQQTR